MNRLLLAACALLLATPLLPAADNKQVARDLLDIVTQKYQTYPDSIRLKSLEAIARLGPDARPLVPDLLDIVKQKYQTYDDKYRTRAMDAITEILGGDSNSVEGLIRALKDKDEAVRLKAAKVLGRMGEEAKDAIPALTEALKDSDEDVRRVAAAALDKIKGKK